MRDRGFLRLMPSQFTDQPKKAFVDYPYRGTTFRVYEDLSVRGQWCSKCNQFETIEFELGIFVATNQFDGHEEAVGRYLANLWNTFAYLRRDAEPGQHEMKKLLKDRLAIVVHSDGVNGSPDASLQLMK
jgi:hypothetical protein